MVKEVVLAVYDEAANSIAMNAEQAELYAAAYIGEKLACSVGGPEAEAIIKRGYVPVQIVEVVDVQLKATSAEAGHVVGLCELLQLEMKHRHYKKGNRS